MPVLDAQNLSKSLSTRKLLDGVSITIARGEKVGLVGDNGAGKSTLAKILAHVQEPDQGEVRYRRGAKVAYLDQEPRFAENQSAHQAALNGLSEWLAARELYDKTCLRLAEPALSDVVSTALLAEQEEASALVEQLGGWNRQQEATQILKMLGIDDTGQSVETMSGGERRRVALAALLIGQPDLAILDEPTNHLDADTIEWFETYLVEEFPGALLLITHDRYLLNQVVDRTLEIDQGKVHSYPGGWEEFLEGREQRRALLRRTEANRQNFLRTELEWLRRQPKARTGKQKARISRAETALEQTAERESKAMSLQLDERRLGSTILETRELRVEVPGRVLVDSLTFQLLRGSRVGIVGRSGAGKTTLIRTLLGQIPAKAGTVTQGKNTSFAYLDQMRSGLDENETVMEAITAGRSQLVVGSAEFSSYSYLERFGFRGEAARQQVASLSGGERARVALARLLLSPANVLVLDEPTNDLDVMTLAALEELVSGLSGAALIVSHDRYFLDRVATSVLSLDGHGSVAHLHGGYSAYAEWRADQQRARRLAVSEKPRAPKPTAARKKLTYAEELELAALMPQIEREAARVAELELELSDPDFYAKDRELAEQHRALLAQCQANVEHLESRWLELEEKRQESTN